MARKYITITYEVWDEEAVDAGDTDERGWIDEEGEDMAPDEYDREDGLDSVDLAVRYLQEHGAYEGNEYGARSASRWWTNYDHHTDYRTGEVEQRSYHLHGFTEDERRRIQRLMEAH